MPRRDDLKSIMILGAGPIVIGQACEFDYSGAQACKALREEGYRVVLVNSNPATIMTDPVLADATYVEPLHWTVLRRVIEVERPDAVLPTMGGQTALNCALDLVREGVLEQYGVELIGANQDAIDKAEDRQRFREAMSAIGLDSPKSIAVHEISEAIEAQAKIGFPTIIRPSFTLGGTGGGIAYNREEFAELCERGLDASPTTEVLIEESVLGWKEFEMEVVRDSADNCIIVCSIENFDPMGVHTGDSITVAPAQTLTDKEYQRLRDASIAVLREIGVDTGGSNVQFAINPRDGRMVVIEMNPRVSRSSALASKATGFPIARVAAKLAVGYTLDELENDITGGASPASFEPSIDYVVTKIPRFNFEKFPSANARLTTQMKSVGEAMAIGRTFQESLQKALCSLETGLDGLTSICLPDEADLAETLRRELSEPGPSRLLYIADAFRAGWSLEQIYEKCAVDPWFLAQLEDLIEQERSMINGAGEMPAPNILYRWKRKGFSDQRLAQLLQVEESELRRYRLEHDIRPVFKRVDSCAAEFATATAYMYSTYDEECEAQPSDRRKIMVLGGGPNRIGQGIEFDYCCVHAALAVRDYGFESIMVNCNPETVSTDFDTSDRLFFEPLTLEHVLSIVELEKPEGVIIQFGGQTPLKLARALEAAGVPIVGTSPDSIDLAEDRERFQRLVQDLGLRQPANRIARTEQEALQLAEEIGYPLVVRPSYVLGGRAMEIVYQEEQLARYVRDAVAVSDNSPVLLDRFLDSAVEVDVDAVSDGDQVLIGGIMEHIEQAGVHSGDSACSLPPVNLSSDVLRRLREQTKALAQALNVCGLMNVQFAIQDDEIFLLEVNPRASRTVPFVAKCTGLALARAAALCMVGQSLEAQRLSAVEEPGFFAVKEAVFPFVKFPGVDPLLGPEMKSTGEVMGIGRSFGEAFAKALLACGDKLPVTGCVFVSVSDRDKGGVVNLARKLIEMGFSVVATRGTARILEAAKLACEVVNKVREGRPHVVDSLKNGEINLIVNTTEGSRAVSDSFEIRRSALQNRVPYSTTLAGGLAMAQAIEYLRGAGGHEFGESGKQSLYSVHTLQDLHQEIGR